MMALKKLPKNMTYEAVRYKHPPTPNHAPGPTPVEDVNTTVEPSTRPLDNNENVAVDDAGPVVPTSGEPNQAHVPVDPPEPESEPAPRSAARKRTAASKSVRVRGYVHVPMAGGHPDFDELKEIYGEKEALALALSHGMASYESALREADALKPLPHSVRGKRRIEASRSMAHDLYPKAVDHLDPKKMLGRSQVGSRILDVALAYYLGKN